MAEIPNPASRLVPITVKLSEDELLELEELAFLHASGNRSSYIRAALEHYEPAPEDFPPR